MSFKLEITGECVTELRCHAIYAATSLMTTEELERELENRKQFPKGWVPSEDEETG